MKRPQQGSGRGSEFFASTQLKYREESRKELSTNLYAMLAETPETKLARAATELQSQVGGVGHQGALSPPAGGAVTAARVQTGGC